MKTKKNTNKAKAVKIDGGYFVEWYAPTFKDPYEDIEEYRAFYDEKILPKDPVSGPAVDGGDETLNGDLGCLCDRMTCGFLGFEDCAKASRALEKLVKKALATGEAQIFKTTDYAEAIKITPYKNMPKIPEKAFKRFGKFAKLVKERVAAI